MDNLVHDPRQWSFVADMNYSGAVTISDVWLWVKWLFFYPGDMSIYYLVNGARRIGQFLEVTYDDYGGFLSGWVSGCVWVLVLTLIFMLADFYADAGA